MGQPARDRRTVGRYVLLNKIAAGGMGEVHLARLSSMEGVEKYFAIKLLLPQYAEEQSVVDMFITEARIAARIAHPNVCQVFELGIENDELFICMEYLRGIPVNAILKSHKPLNPLRTDIVVSIIQQSCAGLQFAHELKDDEGNNLGVVHRDISPGNIFLTSEGTAKVLDFGVVKANDTASKTRTGVLKGKFGYMSPEQIMAKPVDRRSDVFSLGIVLFELLTNRRLFARESEYATLKAITETPITELSSLRPDLPPELGDVVRTALSRDLDERYGSMKEFSQALGAVMKRYGGVADATEIADYVQDKYSTQLETTDKMLQAASLARQSPSLKYTPAMGMTVPNELEQTQISEHATQDVAPLEFRKRRTSGLVISILMAGLAVIVLAAAIFFKNNTPVEAQQKPTRIGLSGNGELTPENLLDTQVSEMDSAPTPEVTDAGGTITVPDARKRSVSKPTQVSGCAAKPTSKARNTCFVAKNSRKLKACLTKHSSEISEISQIRLEFALNKSGKATAVDIAPAEFQSMGVGTCLRSVAKKIRFGAQEQEIRFQIPLRFKR